MAHKLDRRGFIKQSTALSIGGAAAFSFEEKVLLAKEKDKRDRKTRSAPKDPVPTGKLGGLTVSRLIMGGNLIGGWAHSRDLIYVSDLLKNYFTDEKILETLELSEQHGINTINTHPNARGIINRYRRERGGKIQWLVQGFPKPRDLTSDIQESIDNGADAVYIQGNVGDALVKHGKIDVIAKVVEFIQDNGLPAGVGSHSLDVPMACRKAGIKPDFYVKTLHSNNYWSARRPDQHAEVLSNRTDNYWCMDPEATIEFMQSVDVPWIAFKVLAAGAIHPKKGFEYAFKSGADFVCAGMFDFQVGEDAAIAKKTLARVRDRLRPWRA